MTISELEVNSEIVRGVRVDCQNCPNPNDSFVWKTLYFKEREPGTKLTPIQIKLARETAKWHEKECPDHHIVIFWMRKLLAYNK